MHKIIKNTLLNYIQKDFAIELQVNPARIYKIKNCNPKTGAVVYLCSREIRCRDNFALQYALQISNNRRTNLKIITPQVIYEYKPKQKFIDKQIEKAKNDFINCGLDFEIVKNGTSISNYLKQINPAVIILDFNPISDNKNFIKNLSCEIFEVDSHNIVPARYVSDKQEYGAFTIRRKIYQNIGVFLNEFENITPTPEINPIIDNFIQNGLPYYYEYKNDFSKNILSGFSKYLNLGFISKQRIALEVIKSKAETINKEAFLEELIVRSELAENFCLYCDNYKSYECISSWAKESVKAHQYDLRFFNYTKEEFEKANTHDKLWNASQKQLIKEGVIHGYLRMYWAKKIFEWCDSPYKALDIAIYLNDKYAYDSPSSNGYTGILWAMGGVHDRAFINYPVTGKIRRMTFDSIKRKYDTLSYINRYYKI